MTAFIDDSAYARQLWQEFGEVPIDDHDCITCDWRSFAKGTNRFDVWKWFEDFFQLSIEEVSA